MLPHQRASQKEERADIQAVPTPAPAQAAETTYTVRAGDTLSKIAQQELGDAKAYMAIFEANRNLLKDPDKIQPGPSTEDSAVGPQIDEDAGAEE